MKSEFCQKMEEQCAACVQNGNDHKCIVQKTEWVTATNLFVLLASAEKQFKCPLTAFTEVSKVIKNAKSVSLSALFSIGRVMMKLEPKTIEEIWVNIISPEDRVRAYLGSYFTRLTLLEIFKIMPNTSSTLLALRNQGVDWKQIVKEYAMFSGADFKELAAAFMDDGRYDFVIFASIHLTYDKRAFLVASGDPEAVSLFYRQGTNIKDLYQWSVEAQLDMRRDFFKEIASVRIAGVNEDRKLNELLMLCQKERINLANAFWILGHVQGLEFPLKLKLLLEAGYNDISDYLLVFDDWINLNELQVNELEEIYRVLCPHFGFEKVLKIFYNNNLNANNAIRLLINLPSDEILENLFRAGYQFDEINTLENRKLLSPSPSRPITPSKFQKLWNKMIYS